MIRQHVGMMEAAKICGKSYSGFKRKVDMGQVPYFMDGAYKRFYVDEITQEAKSECHIKCTKDQTAQNITRTYPSAFKVNRNTRDLALTPLSEIKP